MEGGPPLAQDKNLLGGMSCTPNVCSWCKDEKSEKRADGDFDEQKDDEG